MRMATFLRSFGLLVALAGLALPIACIGGGADAARAPSAGSSTWTPAMQQLVTAAQREGEVNILEQTFAEEAFLQDVEQAMNAKYGISIRLNGTGGPSMSQMVTRLIDEHRAGQMPSTDLLYTSQRQRLELQEAGVTEPVDWKQYDPTLKEEEITHDGSGIVSWADAVGLVYNTQMIQKDELPKTVEDLADPKWKSKIATTPYGTGWGEMAMVLGAARAKAVAERTAPNVGGYTDSANFTPVATGQFPLFAFTGSSGRVALDREKGAPIDVVFPFRSYFLYSIDMLKGSPHPNASRLVALFMRTPEGQEILWRHQRQDSPFLETSKAYRQVQESRAAGDDPLLYTEVDVVEHANVFNELVPYINKYIRERQ